MAKQDEPLKVLDVGCGIGGSSRYIARALGDKCTTVTLPLTDPLTHSLTHSLTHTRYLRRVDIDAVDFDFPDRDSGRAKGSVRG